MTFCLYHAPFTKEQIESGATYTAFEEDSARQYHRHNLAYLVYVIL